MLSFFPLDVLDEIWDLIESIFEGLLTYSFNRCILSEEYHRHLLPLLGIPFAEHILTSVMFTIQKNILKNKADTMISEYPCCPLFPPKDTVLSVAGRGKLRYT